MFRDHGPQSVSLHYGAITGNGNRDRNSTRPTKSLLFSARVRRIVNSEDVEKTKKTKTSNFQNFVFYAAYADNKVYTVFRDHPIEGTTLLTWHVLIAT